MIVKLRFSPGRRVRKASGKNRHVALAVAALLTPATLTFFVMAIWRIASDIEAATEFPITEGVWKHWQMWGGAAIASQVCSVLLNRYGRTGSFQVIVMVVRAMTFLFGRVPHPEERRSAARSAAAQISRPPSES